MTRNFLFATLFVIITTSKIVLGEEAFAGTCGGTGKGNTPVDDFHKWKSLNAHEFPANGWLNGEEVQSLVDRSQNVGAHFCKDVRYDQFGQDQFTFAGYAICRADTAEIAVANDCVSFATFNDRTCANATYCGVNQFEGDCSNVENGSTFSCGNAPFSPSPTTTTEGSGADGTTGTDATSNNAGGGGSIGTNGDDEDGGSSTPWSSSAAIPICPVIVAIQMIALVAL